MGCYLIAHGQIYICWIINISITPKNQEAEICIRLQFFYEIRPTESGKKNYSYLNIQIFVDLNEESETKEKKSFFSCTK